MRKFKKIIVCMFALFGITACDLFNFGPKQPDIQEITLTQTSITLNAGEDYQIEYVTAPDDVGQEHLNFEVENIGIASVDDYGYVKAKGNGTTNIIVSSKYDENVKATFQITSKGVSLYNYALNTKVLSMHVGDTKQIKKTVYPENATNKDAIYTSSDEYVATVDNEGNVYAENVGNAVITVMSEDRGIIDTCNVTVCEDDKMLKSELKYTIKDYRDNYTKYYCDDTAPTTGNVNILALPIWFTDSNQFITNKEQVRNDIETSLFGTNEETGWRSVKTFYEEESFGGIRIGGTVANWYECGKSYVNYGVKNKDDMQELIYNALADFKTKNPNFDWSLYDQDNNGYVDSIFAVYAAPTYNSLQRTEYNNLWSYFQVTNYYEKVGNPTPGSYIFSSYSCMYPSENIALSHTGKSSYFDGQGNLTLDAHVYIHEFGHNLGIKDYYDYANESSPTGRMGMQDADAYMHDPFSEMVFGWTLPYIPTESCEIWLNNFVDSGDFILLSPNFNSFGSPFDEYLLINVFSPTKLNEFDSINKYNSSGDFTANDYGVQIWHVDARLIKGDEKSEWNMDNITLVPTAQDGVMFAFTNSSKNATEDRLEPLGKDYADYQFLYLIRNYPDLSYKANYNYNGNDLFKEGDTFSMGGQFSAQFLKGDKLNQGQSLGWEIEVAHLDEEGANIRLTRV